MHKTKQSGQIHKHPPNKSEQQQLFGRRASRLHLQSSKVVPGDANARRLRSSSLSLVTWRSWNRMVSRLSPDGRLSFMAGGGEDASPFTGEPATVSTLPEARTVDQRAPGGVHPPIIIHLQLTNGTQIRFFCALIRLSCPDTPENGHTHP